MIGGDNGVESNGRLARTVGRTSLATDTFCLVVITLLSSVPYFRNLGFYSDDWSILAYFDAHRGSWLGALFDGFNARPVQGLYLGALFEVFGFRPLGYHIVNHIVLAGCAALFYLLLVRLRVGRSESFVAVLLFIMLPQLSTVRVWYAAFQVPLSLGLMLISMHLQLSFARRGKPALLVGATATALLSIGAYEIFAPMLAGFALGLWMVRRPGAATMFANRASVAALFLLASVLLAAAYKLSFSDRAGTVTDPGRYAAGIRQLFRLDYDWRVDSSLNIIATPSTHFWAPVRGAWIGAQALISGDAGRVVIGLALLIALLIGWRLYRQCPSFESAMPKRLLLVGISAFLLGNATFLVVPAVVFTSTGVGNRVHVASALGAALIFTAAIFALTALAPRPARRALLHLMVIAFSISVFARLALIERYWAEAPAMQAAILNAARVDLRDVPAGSTVILDGVCPYHGPAIIFEADWDVGGALTLALGKPLLGDVVTSRMAPAPGGLRTSIYKVPSNYPYGEHLYIYDPSQRRLLRLVSADMAMRYFAARNRTDCPGYVARGEEV